MTTTKPSTMTIILLLVSAAVIAGNTFLRHEVSNDLTLFKFFSNAGAALGFVFGVFGPKITFAPARIALTMFAGLFFLGAITIAVLIL